MGKKKYFNILKTKKSRDNFEDDDEEEVKENNNKHYNTNTNNINKFFNYKHNSSESNDSSSGDQFEQEELCDRFSLASLNSKSFKRAFTTSFVSLNQHKEEDLESLTISEDKSINTYNNNIYITERKK